MPITMMMLMMVMLLILPLPMHHVMASTQYHHMEYNMPTIKDDSSTNQKRPSSSHINVGKTQEDHSTRHLLVKRAPLNGVSGGNTASLTSGGQPEEIFSLGNRLDSNYDEYPMVVPKRAALLLDRLMVALHHALEKERRKIGEFYEPLDSKEAFVRQQQLQNKHHHIDAMESEASPSSQYASLMYSDDDPSVGVGLDYDFKDLRDLDAINRATGQTLIANSLQRRANNIRGSNLGVEKNNDHDGIAGSSGDRLTWLRATPLNSGATAATTVSGGATTATSMTNNGSGINSSVAVNGGLGVGVGVGVGVGGVRNNIGRMYWRCYFNAVSCF